MSRDPDMEDAVSGIGSVLDVISDNLKRIATAQEAIAEEVRERQRARHVEVRRRHQFLTQRLSEGVDRCTRHDYQGELGELVEIHPWLKERAHETSDNDATPLLTALQWAAQTAHQAYHTHQPGTWRDCPMNLCASIRHELGMEDDDGND